MQAKLEDEITAIQLEAELTARSLKTSVAVSQAKARRVARVVREGAPGRGCWMSTLISFNAR